MLAPLRDQGVLIVGSGSLTHNLRELGGGAQASSVARKFADWVWQQIGDGNLDALLNYRSAAPAASLAHPRMSTSCRFFRHRCREEQMG